MVPWLRVAVHSREVLKGFELLQRSSLGPRGEKMGTSVPIVAAYILQGGTVCLRTLHACQILVGS